MKTANLTKWSNLYSTELKSNLIVKPSYVIAELIIGLLLISVIFFNVNYFERANTAWALNIASVIIFALVYVISRQIIALNKTQHFLAIDGYTNQVIYQLHKYSIDQASRIALWGCYLHLSPYDDQSVTSLSSKSYIEQYRKWWNTRLIFIDRRQLSAQEYSTLCFIIKRIQSVKY